MTSPTFQPGKTYTTRSACDYDCVISVKVVSRTAKTIKTADGKTLRIGDHGYGEFVKPWGSYSMAPMVSAERGQ